MPTLLRWAAVAFLLSLSFDALPWAAILGEGDTLSSVVGRGLVIVFLASGQLARIRVGGAAGWWFLAFAAVSALTELNRWMILPADQAGESLRVYFTTIQVFGMFFIFFNIAHDRKVREALFAVFVWTNIIFSVVGNVRWVAGLGVLDTGRMSLLERNENELALSFGIAAVCLVWWLLSSPRVSKGKRIAGGLAVASLLFGMIQTGSRGGALATATGLFIVAAVSFRMRRAVLYLAIVPVIAWSAGVAVSRQSVLAQRFVAAIEGTDRGTRPELIEAGIRVAAQEPWLGVGPAHDKLLGADLGFQRISAHNTFLQVALAFGIAGLVPYLLFISVSFRHAWKNRLEPEGALALAVVTMFVVKFFLAHTLNNKVAWIVFALAACVGQGARQVLAGGAARNATSPSWERPRVTRATAHVSADPRRQAPQAGAVPQPAPDMRSG